MLKTVCSETAGEPLQALVGEQSVELTEIQRSILWLLFPSWEELKSIRKTKEEASDPDRGHSVHNATPEKPFPKCSSAAVQRQPFSPDLPLTPERRVLPPRLPTPQL